MLDIRPNCEWCDVDLPPDSQDAFICSYECTHCRACVENVLFNVCPTCGGGFAPRPIRPKGDNGGQSGLGLAHHPAGAKRHHSKWTADEVTAVSSRLRNTPAHER